MRVLFTGGSGKAGRHAVAYLVRQGHKVLNVDKVLLDNPDVNTRLADITDAGQMFDIMASYVATVDQLRLWLNDQIQTVQTMIQDLLAQDDTAPAGTGETTGN